MSDDQELRQRFEGDVRQQFKNDISRLEQEYSEIYTRMDDEAQAFFREKVDFMVWHLKDGTRSGNVYQVGWACLWLGRLLEAVASALDHLGKRGGRHTKITKEFLEAILRRATQLHVDDEYRKTGSVNREIAREHGVKERSVERWLSDAKKLPNHDQVLDEIIFKNRPS